MGYNQRELEMLYGLLKDVSLEKSKLNDMQHDILKRIRELNEKSVVAEKLDEASENNRVEINDVSDTHKDDNESELNELRELIGDDYSDDVESNNTNSIVGDLFVAPKQKEKVKMSDIKPRVIEIMKNNPKSMRLEDVYYELNDEYDITIKNFRNNIFPRIVNSTSEIKRVDRGLYKYKSLKKPL